MRKGRQRSGGRTSMQRFFSWFRGSRAMLQSSTRSVGVTMLRVWKAGQGLRAITQMQRDEAVRCWRHQCGDDLTDPLVPLTMITLMQQRLKLEDQYITYSLWWIKERWQTCYWLTQERVHHPSRATFALEVLRWLKPVFLKLLGATHSFPTSSLGRCPHFTYVLLWRSGSTYMWET